MLLQSNFLTSQYLIFYSLVFFFLGFFIIKKVSKKIIIFSFTIALIILFLSVFYSEGKIGGTCFSHLHGIPHYYFAETKCFDNQWESAELINSKSIFLSQNFSGVALSLAGFYFFVDLIFWFSLSYFIFTSIDFLKEKLVKIK
jgi:hypothetical protein